ncbi:MAG: helix-turn-helix domain-containing protein [Bacteroidota bacterium]
MEFLFIVAIAQTLIACYLLWNDFIEKKAERYLLIFLGLLSAHLSVKFFVLQVFGNDELFKNFPTSFSLSYGPLIYLFFWSKKNKKVPTKSFQLLQLSPFILFTFIYLTVAISLLFDINPAILQPYNGIASIVILASHVGYFGYITFELVRSKDILVETKWLLLPVTTTLITIVSVFITLIFQIDFQIYRILGPLSAVIWVVSILKNSVFNKTEKTLDPKPVIKIDEVEVSRKYEKSGLGQKQAEGLVLKLDYLMRVDKVFLNPQLTLKELADQLEVSKHHLTEVLNRHVDQTFYQYVNGFRIEEVKRRIDNNEGESLLEMAFAAGFQSKGTFNSYFKLIVGTTPSTYRKKQQSEPVS